MKRIGPYLITDEVIGKGSFSEVKIAFHLPTFSPVAVKIYELPLTLDAQASLTSECHAGQVLQSTHIVGVSDRYTSRHRSYLIMDYCPGNSLATIIEGGNRVKEQVVRRWSAQLLDQLLELRRKNIVHRDLKPANILYDRSFVRICDFSGATDAYDGTYLTGDIGTPYYQAPEVLQGAQYDFRVDVWSLGVTIAELLMGRHPFAAARTREQLLALHQSPLFPSDSSVSPLAQSFILSMLHIDPQNRPTFDQLRRHYFLEDLPEPLIDLDQSYSGGVEDLELSNEQVKGVVLRLIGEGRKGIAKGLVRDFLGKCRGIKETHAKWKGVMEEIWEGLGNEPESSPEEYRQTVQSYLVQSLVITSHPFDSAAVICELKQAYALLALTEKRNMASEDWLSHRQTLIHQLFQRLSI